ncbi:DUF4241 domain-containing protein [Curtobacterium sp. Leaf261]|uniref:DUF4241 domain-containing protein n=1 Tax=Curtobacterium sp. Leaf261 TaxID=1736311 RepID=UPI0006F5DEA7|nr:DUF4241 domain-containing protein [Curtobacterium sp. Leaf261]KQO62850.1 hypothetical protein ASF23_07960 [Curtobacterium sp. Leaf261]
MDIADFHALRPGNAPSPDGSTVVLSVRELGTVRVPSGHLGACDPFVALDTPLVVEVPPGDHRVVVTIADVSSEHDGSHLREAYLSVIVADGDVASVDGAPLLGRTPDPGDAFGIGVDTGTVGFVDADAVAASMPEDPDWYDAVFDNGEPGSWFSQMDAGSPLPTGTANIVMPRASAGQNVVLSHSGWGDGAYPLLRTLDAGGTLLGIHIDLLVAGPLDDEATADPDDEATADLDDGATTGSDDETAVSSDETGADRDRQPRSWLRRLFGR